MPVVIGFGKLTEEELAMSSPETDPDKVQKKTNKPTGFEKLSKEERSRIASIGGKAAHAQGTAHRFAPGTAEAAAAGKRGGEALKKKYGREYMVEIGKKGGEARRRRALLTSATADKEQVH